MTNERQSRFYNRIPAHALSAAPRVKIGLEMLRQVKAHRLLDIGCGDGDGSIAIRKATGAVDLYGIDISQSAVELARKKGVQAVRVNLDSEDLPFPDSFFDAIVAFEIIEHLYDPDHLMSEVRRVITKGGKIAISTPNMAWWLNRVSLTLGYQPFFTEVSTIDPRLGKMSYEQSIPVGHLRIFASRTLHEFLRLHGFRVIRERPAKFGSSRLVFDFVDSLMSRIPSLAADIVVLCEKVR